MSVCLLVYRYIFLSCLLNCLSACLYVFPSICLSDSVYLTVFLSVCQHKHFLCLTVCLSIPFVVFLPTLYSVVCLSVSLPIFFSTCCTYSTHCLIPVCLYIYPSLSPFRERDLRQYLSPRVPICSLPFVFFLLVRFIEACCV